MDAREATAPFLASAAAALGRPVIGAGRGGASDAAHFAATIPFTVDGLGPRGGGAHAPHEYVLSASIRNCPLRTSRRWTASSARPSVSRACCRR